MSTIPAQFPQALAGQTAAASLSALTLGNKPAAPLSAPGTMPAIDVKAQARTKATEFEASFLGSMFGQMFTGIDGEGPFGGAGGAGVWRSFLSDEYAKSFAKAGGIGLADHVYRSLLAQQEAHAN
jgi:Rod binding domain-containing protein